MISFEKYSSFCKVLFLVLISVILTISPIVANAQNNANSDSVDASDGHGSSVDNSDNSNGSSSSDDVSDARGSSVDNSDDSNGSSSSDDVSDARGSSVDNSDDSNGSSSSDDVSDARGSSVSQNDTSKLGSFSDYDKLGESYEAKGDFLSAYKIYVDKLGRIPSSNKQEIISTYYKITEMSINLRDYTTALKHLRSVKPYLADSNNTEVAMYHELRAEISFNRGNYSEAIGEYDKALSVLTEDDFEDYYRIACKVSRLYEDVENYDYSINSLKMMMGSIPESDLIKQIETKINMARVYAKLGNDDLANQSFNEAAGLSNSLNLSDVYIYYGMVGEVHRELENNNKALIAYQKAFDKIPDTMNHDKINNLITQASICKDLRKFQDGINALEIAFNITNNNNLVNLWTILNNIGDLKAMSGDYEDAITYYDNAIGKAIQLEDNKKRASSEFMKGKVHEKMGNTDLALSLYEDSVRMMEQSKSLTKRETRMFGDMLFEFSDLLRKNKEYDKALVVGERSFKILDSIKSCYKVKALLNLGNIYFGMGEYSKVKAYYEEALGCHGLSHNIKYKAKILNNLAVITSKEGDYEKATEYYKESIEIKEQYEDYQGVVNTFWNLAILYEKQSMFSEAIDVLEKAVFLIDNYGLSEDGQGDKFLDYIFYLELMVG